MPASQTHIGPDTPMGATARPGGCTFRCWAPRALGVWVTGSFNGWSPRAEAQRLVRDPSGCWAGFVPGVGAGAQYKFYVDGPGSRGYKRDPHAREIVAPDWNCVVTDPAAYPWHDAGFRPPAYEDLIIYQLHVGTFFAVDAAGADRRQGRVATFLDAIDRIPYLAELGVTAVQPLPIVEFPTAFSLGYNGTDYFSPEFTYAVPEAELGPSLRRANALLAARGHAPWRRPTSGTPPGSCACSSTCCTSTASRCCSTSSTITRAVISATRACTSSTGSRRATTTTASTSRTGAGRAASSSRTGTPRCAGS
ncbi:hypothetical protein QA634_05865 [Methylobacterium sp. CB376]|uniref:hypothetical protein n=1 Tax=Methylobacterium sp. CB376 TaxID=3138063 RepID=UPI0024B1D5E2|nr:hypothetical protein [Methylobacterium nodulans]WFT81415.1 hypothetical protein QA634_05865 [Methylobacterium nodulans]